MKTYAGKRTDRGAIVTVNDDHGLRELDARRDLFNHSPNGFEWGYGGSGPAQLALALCADVLGDDKRAVRIHQRFKFAVVAGIATDEWAWLERDVLAFVESLEAGTPRHE